MSSVSFNSIGGFCLNSIKEFASDVDCVLRKYGGQLFAVFSFLYDFQRVREIYKIHTFKKEINWIQSDAQKSTVQKAKDSIQLIRNKFRPHGDEQLKSYLSSSTNYFAERAQNAFIYAGDDSNATIFAEIELNKLIESLNRDLFHLGLDMLVGIIGGLFFATLFISSAAILAVAVPLLTVLFWGVWAVSEIDKIIQAFQSGAPNRYKLLLKFIVTTAIFVTCTAVSMGTPIGWAALACAGFIGLAYLAIRAMESEANKKKEAGVTPQYSNIQ